MSFFSFCSAQTGPQVAEEQLKLDQAPAAAQAQSARLADLYLEEHPLAHYNGPYKKAGDYAGWPYYVNGAGIYMYQHKDKWVLNEKFKPDKDVCNSEIKSKYGPVPIGSQDTWKTIVAGGELATYTTFTVTEMVRHALQWLPPTRKEHSCRCAVGAC